MANKPTMFKRAFYRTPLEDKHCEFCGLALVRAEYPSGRETASHYNHRRYCNRQCQGKAQRGSNNPNYKGIEPKCVDCGKPVAYGSRSSKQAKRCRDCFEVWAAKTGYYQTQPGLIKIAEAARQSKGVMPEHLKAYVFKKGMTPHNKKAST